MRIVHVVTLVSDDGAFGGPVSVAAGQLAELAERGHHVELLALWRATATTRTSAPTMFAGVPMRARPARTLIPGLGFLGLLHPALVLDLWRRIGRAEMVHIHAGRDLVSLCALAVAAVRGRRFFVQTHGMVQPRHRLLPRLFDRLFVPLLRRATGCLVLTEQEKSGLAKVLGRRGAPPLIALPNGVNPRPAGGPASEGAGPAEGSPLVLFLARLHPRKRPEAFVEMAAMARTRWGDAQFVLHGADEGALPGVLDLINRRGLSGTVRYAGPVSHDSALHTLARAAVYVLPSMNEPFPMTVLEALSVGTPVVCTNSCGIAPALAERGAALITDGSAAGLAAAVDRVLGDERLRRSLVEAGHQAVTEAFSVRVVVGRLEELYGARAGR